MQIPKIAATILLNVASPALVLSHSQPSIVQAPTPTSEERITEAVTF